LRCSVSASKQIIQHSEATCPGSIIPENADVELADEAFEIGEVVAVDREPHIFESYQDAGARWHGGGEGRGDALFQNFDIIKWMEYRTVFDILQVGYRSWPSVLIGVAFMLARLIHLKALAKAA
jgi:hypothetical protein